jgi:hypothetical protein
VTMDFDSSIPLYVLRKTARRPKVHFARKPCLSKYNTDITYKFQNYDFILLTLVKQHFPLEQACLPAKNRFSFHIYLQRLVQSSSSRNNFLTQRDSNRFQ